MKRTHTQSRKVHLCIGVNARKKGLGRGKSPKLWAFSMLDLEMLLGMSRRTIERAIADGRIDPTNLRTILDFYVALVLNKHDKNDTNQRHE